MVALWSSWYSMLMKKISGGYCVDMFGVEAGEISKLDQNCVVSKCLNHLSMAQWLRSSTPRGRSRVQFPVET